MPWTSKDEMAFQAGKKADSLKKRVQKLEEILFGLADAIEDEARYQAGGYPDEHLLKTAKAIRKAVKK